MASKFVIGPILTLALLFAAAAEGAEPSIDFGRQVQPILSDRCYKCHGPDEARRQGELRLDEKGSAFATHEGKRRIVPGKSAESEMIRRLFSSDPDEQMPPPDSKLQLSGEEKELLKRWVDEGATWGTHWSFVAPRRPAFPQAKLPGWARNGIDPFVLARLEGENLGPSPEADKRTLVRRVTLDLTGLPPTAPEVAEFLADDRPDAYERLVDRLLASPRYGERMALPWLDAARYADTSGYQSDGPRHMWRWRDWVIESLNGNMPFDQFTVEQLAGDLLPKATLQQKIATGFNRNHRGNAEGGIIAAEYEVEYVVDRVDTTSTVWLGLTLGCTRCHDHKYDPFTQEEFYKLYAYFNSIPEHGRALKEGNSPPYLSAPTRLQSAEIERLTLLKNAAENDYREANPEGAQAKWEREVNLDSLPDWSFSDSRIVRLELEGGSEASAKGSALTYEPGRIGKAGRFDGANWLEAGDIANFGYFDKFTITAWIRPDGKRGGTIVSRMTDVEEGDGYSVVVRDGRIHVYLVKRWLDDAIRTETLAEVIAPDRWQHVAVTYDGSRKAQGIRVYIDGEETVMQPRLDSINQTFAAKDQPLRIGAGGGTASRFHGAIDEVQIFKRDLSLREVGIVATAESLRELVAMPARKRSLKQGAKLSAYFIAEAAPVDLRRKAARMFGIAQERDELIESLPNVMVMQELEKSRPAFLLQRGQYDRPGKQVSRGTPKSLPPSPPGAPSNRLGFAQWLVDRSNPLTARVAVNRQWQVFFGNGLVRTAEDFGTQGERPTHPELLDCLAVELQESGWDMKRLHRLIVTSATYRQSSRVTAELAARDPENKLVARGARFRLPAQVLRDQALALGGLLVETIGGPSVKPYQPAGLWEELAGGGSKYVPDVGAGLYRRSLYTYWKRTAAPPSLMTFDAADRETCVVRRPRTNTPLQALALLNETTFVEAARQFAARSIEQAPSGMQRVEWMFLEATGRVPEPKERAILDRSLAAARARFSERREEAEKLLQVGESPRAGQHDAVELASLATVASLILNLDEVVTKE